MEELCPRARMQRATVRGATEVMEQQCSPLNHLQQFLCCGFFSSFSNPSSENWVSLNVGNMSQIHCLRQQRPAFSCPLTFIFGTDSFPKAPINLAVLVHRLRDGNVKNSWTEMKRPPKPLFWRQLKCKLSLARHLDIKMFIRSSSGALSHHQHSAPANYKTSMWGKCAQNSRRKNRMRHFILGQLSPNWNFVCFELTEPLACQSPARH